MLSDGTLRGIKPQATTYKIADRDGMYVTVSVLSGGQRPVLVVPATAVLFAPYGDSVFVVEDKKDAPPQAANGPEKPEPAVKPASATSPATPGGNGKIVRQKFVRLGERRGDFVEVTSGVQAGEVIASSGGFKLRNGMSVTVNNALAPQAELNPKPAD